METLLNRRDSGFATQPTPQRGIARDRYAFSADPAFVELYLKLASFQSQTTFVPPSHECVYGHNINDPGIGFHKMIRLLKDQGLPISAIADIGRVERKTVYAWLEGSAAKPHNEERMESHYQALIAKGEGSLRHLYRLWRKPLDNGKSLSELLSAEHLDHNAIDAALAICWPMAVKYESIATASARSQKPQFGGNPITAEIPESYIDDESEEDSR